MMSSWFYWFPFIPLPRQMTQTMHRQQAEMSPQHVTPSTGMQIRDLTGGFHGSLVPQKLRHWREGVQLRALFCCGVGLTCHLGLASWCFTSPKASVTEVSYLRPKLSVRSLIKVIFYFPTSFTYQHKVTVFAPEFFSFTLWTFSYKLFSQVRTSEF